MWKCPICKTDNQENRICVKCGFDDSLNYLSHKTIGHLPDIVALQFVKDIEEQSVMVVGEGNMRKTLKKVSCIYCENEWYVDEAKKDRVKVCPFCKKEIEKDYTFELLKKLLVEEEGVTESLANILVSNLKGEVLKSKGQVSVAGTTQNKPTEKTSSLSGGKFEKQVKLTYKECSRLKGLSWNAGTRFDIPEGYTHIMSLGLEPVRWDAREIRIPKSVRYIAPDALKGFRDLQRVIVHPENKVFEIQQGALLNKITKEVLWNEKK